MKTTVEALKDYYVEIGGTSTDVEDVVTIPDMIDAITALGGGSLLPDVTADDNGDVLTVVEGEWTKSAPQLPFKIVKASYSDNTITFTNETQKSICEAIKNGQLVVVSTIVNTATNYSLIFNVASVNTNSSKFIVGFLSVHRESGIGTVYREFSISDTSTSTTASLSSAFCNDYHSGGPI